MYLKVNVLLGLPLSLPSSFDVFSRGFKTVGKLLNNRSLHLLSSCVLVGRLFGFVYGATHVHAEDSRAAVLQAIAALPVALSSSSADLCQVPRRARRCSCESRTVR